MFKRICFLSLGLLFVFGCNSKRTETSDDDVSITVRDFDEILESGKLRALIAYSSTSYFLYKGRPMGYEYELLEKLAAHFDLELELIVAEDLNSLLTELDKGNVDLVAYG